MFAAFAAVLAGCTTPAPTAAPTAASTGVDPRAGSMAPAPISGRLAAARRQSAPPVLIMGQDLGAIRGYLRSGCCPPPDGATTYVDFYNVTNPDGGFGALGIDNNAEPIELELDWGAGPLNAWTAATEFGDVDVAIGLSLTENAHPGALSRLVAGDYDANIRKLADYANAVPGLVYLRIGYEFDGFWNAGYGDAGRFVAAWRRIVDGLRREGVRNVLTVWQGAASTTDDVLDGGARDEVRAWYPGDDYVDWVGLSWFMHPDERPGVSHAFDVPTPRALADELIGIARERGKPVMIAEAAPQAYDLRELTTAFHSPIWDGPAGEGVEAMSAEQIWAAWFQPMFDYMNANADVIRGLAYINVRWDDQGLWDTPYESGYWGDSRVEANATIARRFNAAVAVWKSRASRTSP